MGNKFSKKELLKIADSGLAELSCEQIKQFIARELEKDYENINTDYIDLCFNVLAMKQTDIPSSANNLKLRGKKITAKKALAFAAAFMLLIATTLTVSANVFHFNIPKEISSWISGDAETDVNLKLANTAADGYLLENSQLATELKTQGITPVTLPEEMTHKKCEIIKIDNLTTDEAISINVKVEFYYDNSFGRLVVSKYSDNFEWAGEIIDEDVLSADMINVNGMDILIFESRDNCTIRYKDNQTTYEIYLETDFENAKLFAQSIK